MGLFDFLRRKADPVSWFAGTDNEMLNAIHKAQASYATFVSAISDDCNRVVPAIEESLVKYAFPAHKKGVKVEHMFLGGIRKHGDKLFGSVASSPQYTDQVKEGMQIEIDPSRLSDWLYVVDGKGTGGFTFQVMWSRFSLEEKAAYGNQAPFVWINKAGHLS